MGNEDPAKVTGEKNGTPKKYQTKEWRVLTKTAAGARRSKEKAGNKPASKKGYMKENQSKKMGLYNTARTLRDKSDRGKLGNTGGVKKKKKKGLWLLNYTGDNPCRR